MNNSLMQEPSIVLYRTPPAQRLRAAAAAVHSYDPRLADVWRWYAEQIERHEHMPTTRRPITKGQTHVSDTRATC